MHSSPSSPRSSAGPIVPFAAIFLLATLTACGPDSPGAKCPTSPSPGASPAATGSSVTVPATTAEDGSDAPSSYDKPPKEILDVLRAPSTPSVYVSPTAERMLIVAWEEYPSIRRVAEPFLRLAGVRLEPKNRSKHDTPGGYGIRPCAKEFSVVDVATGAESKIALPNGACPSAPSWSTDGARFAFQNTTESTVELWVGDGKTGEVKRIDGVRLNPMLDSTVQWLDASNSLLVKTVPADAVTPPPTPKSPPGPSIQETNGEKGESSTYETRDTLTNKHDEALFDFYGTSQLAVVDLAKGTVKSVGAPAIYTDVDAAPDAVHVRVESVKRPYSYVTTYDRFPHDVSILDLAKNETKLLVSLPMADRVPVHGVPTGPRDFEWRATDPATLVWAEALDGGDWKVKVPARDKILMQKAPFTAPATEVARTEQRFAGVAWTATPSLAFLREYDDNRHWRRTFVWNADAPKAKPEVLWDLSTDERYKNPGSFVYRVLPNGAWVVRQDGDTVYLSGSGASPEGDRPFFDRLDLKTKKTTRLFRSSKNALESFVGFASPKPNETSFLTWHQSPKDPPNAFLRSLGAPIPSAPEGEPTVESTSKAITHFPDPAPAVRAIQKRLVKYKRKDGTDLSFTVYTPPGYKEGTRVPSILYAYPLDYADAKKAGQVTGSEQTFTRLRQYRLLLLAGYAIIDNAAFPIVGDPKKAYDTYLEQLVDDAKAAVDKAVEIGVADPERIGVTGHSHGALMTANLLAHSDLFRAGVATSGSYNKTLTPFGFQNERRSVWEAQSVYLKASTFFYADKLTLPLLIMHGDDDANPGTTPLQAKKLYEAIRGNGGTARLVMLPHEPHWYTAMESNEQLVAEMLKWFDKYVKNAPPRAAKEPKDGKAKGAQMKVLAKAPK
ncbi:MAG: prolyl oligopeptidase family serine peptidase [Polyangiaceae bacterium]